MPDRLRGWLLTGAELLQLMTAEETAELVGGVDPTGMGDDVVALADTNADLEKAGARNSKSDQTKIQTMHDHCCALGAECSNDASSNTGKVNGVGGTGLSAELTESMQKAGITIDLTPSEAISKLLADRTTHLTRITELEAMPTIGKAFLRSVAKGADVVAVEDAEAIAKAEAETQALEASMTPEQRAHAQLSKMFAQQGRTS